MSTYHKPAQRMPAEMPVMARKCKSCPFGPNGSKEVRESVECRILTASQTCHHTGSIHGRPDTHLCRGARDIQLELMARLGVIHEATDAAWSAAWKAVVDEPNRLG